MQQKQELFDITSNSYTTLNKKIMLLSLLFRPPTNGIENNSGVNNEEQFLFLYSVSVVDLTGI